MPVVADAHVRSAIPPLLDELVPILVQREGEAVLATAHYESPSVNALKGAISCAVADRLAMTFPVKAGVDALALPDSTDPNFTLTHAEPIGAAPGIGTMDPHPECKPMYHPPFYGATGGLKDNGPPQQAVADGPRGTENRLGRLPIEN